MSVTKQISGLDLSKCRPIVEARIREIMDDVATLNDPIYVSIEMTVLDGGHRVEASKRLGLTTVECNVVDDFHGFRSIEEEIKFMGVRSLDDLI